MFMITLREVTKGDINLIYEKIDSIRWQSGATLQVLGFVRIEYKGEVYLIKPNTFKKGITHSALPESEKNDLLKWLDKAVEKESERKGFINEFII